MVWIAILFLVITVIIVALNTFSNRWNMGHWTTEPRAMGGTVYRGPKMASINNAMVGIVAVAPGDPSSLAGPRAVAHAYDAVLDASGFLVFSNWVCLSLFVGFLLPLWSLSFATEAIGGDRESRTLVWLLTRPLPRSSIYAAKFLALLPWTLGLCLGGFALLGLAAGKPGLLAVRVYWPAVVLGTLAFCSLFQFFGVISSSPSILAIVYCFFFEILVGNMPGQMKRASLGFYVRCLMLDEADAIGVGLYKTNVFEPVDGWTACIALVAVTIVFLLLGAFVFSRREYCDEASH